MNTSAVTEMNFEELWSLDYFTVAIMGSSGSGKTTLLRHILKQCKDNYTNVYLFQGCVAGGDNQYSNCVYPADTEAVSLIENRSAKDPIKQMVNEYNSCVTEINNDIKDYNLVLLSKNKEDKNKVIKNIRTIFIFDDFGSNSKDFCSLSDIGRHARTSYIYLIHNDTDLEASARKKITHYLINVAFVTGQVMDLFKDIKPIFDNIKAQFIKSGANKCFLCLKKDDPTDIKYCNLSQAEVEEANTFNSMFYRCSKQRKLIKGLLQQLANELRAKGIE